MHNVWLIARREYLERIRTRGFVVTTILIPLIMAGFIFGYTIIGAKSTANSNIAVVSSDPQLALDLQSELQSAPNSHIVVDAINPAPGNAAQQQAARRDLDRQLDSGNIDGFLWITPPAAPDQRPTFTFTPSSTSGTSTRKALASALRIALMHEQLAHQGLAGTDFQPVAIRTVPAPHHLDRDSAEISVIVLFILMYFVIMLYGMNVARSIIEEKTSRIFEVLLATIRPEAMMAGKIIGVGSVGLTQVGIWLAAAAVLTASSFAANLGGQTIHASIDAVQVGFFFLYFLLGYLFYSAIAAALGAMTNSEQELQQLNMFLVLPLAGCFITLPAVLSHPDGTLARVLSLIPPFTPLIMYVRVSLGHPSALEIAASILLTSASIYGIIWITSRIYRVGVLMYGKRPSIPEILRWLRYS